MTQVTHLLEKHFKKVRKTNDVACTIIEKLICLGIYLFILFLAIYFT